MFSVAEIIYEIILVAEIILFQYQMWLHVKENTEIISKLFYFTCNHGIRGC